MRHSAAIALTLACLGAAVQAQEESPQVFRADVDVIQLDVSVQDQERRPVTGLTAADFEVFENGQRQQLVAVSEVSAATRDRAPSVRMLYVPPDVASNDLADQLGGGRLLAIVIDDKNIPPDSVSITMSTRGLARHIIDSLGPSDLAAVIFAREAGRTQDFTRDRAKLIEAVDGFTPGPLEYLADPGGSRRLGGDVQQFSGTLARSRCQRAEPVVPVLDTVISRFSTVPNLRKTIILLTVGVPVTFVNRNPCDSELGDIMRRAFQRAQRANVNVHTVDPSGIDGYDEYARRLAVRGGRGPGAAQYRFVDPRGQARFDFSRIMAGHTGGRVVARTDDAALAIDQILHEDSSYYLLGYQSSNGEPDGEFRQIDVRVRGSDLRVRTRSGYWARAGDALVNPRQDRPPSSLELGMAGMMGPAGLPLRVNVIPARPGPDGTVAAAVVLTARLPGVSAPATETLTVTRNVYDERGGSGTPVRETRQFAVQPGGDESRHDIVMRLDLEPGRQELRFNVHSALLGRGGTVYVAVDVGEAGRRRVSLSGLALGTAASVPVEAGDAFAGLLPFVPTTARDFAAGETLEAFVRVFQSDDAPVAAVEMTAQVLDADDRIVAETSATLSPEAFNADREADFAFSVPLSELSPGPHLLTMTARLPGSRMTRQELVFRVR